MTALDDLLRTGLDEAVAVVRPTEASRLAGALVARRERRRRRTARRAVTLAAAVVVVLSSVAVLARQDRPDASDRISNVPAPASFSGLGVGWHRLDTGPVPAMYAPSVVWTGSEVVVAGMVPGHARPLAYAYSPSSGDWRKLAAPPFDEAITLAWAGDRVVAVGGSFPSARSASWDPATNRWTDRGRPPVPQAMIETGFGGWRPIDSGAVLVWTGERLLDLTHGSVYDPGAGSWTTLALPDHLLGRYGIGGFGHPVWDGHEVVLGTWSTEAGLAWNATGSSVREVPGLPSELASPGVAQDEVATAWRGRVFVVSGTDAGTAASFDSRTNTWRAEPSVPGMAGGEGCPYLLATVGDRVVSMPCDGGEPTALAAGATTWRPTGPQPFATPCCGPTWVVADDVLVVWSTSTDTANGEAAPFVRASVWVPPA